MAGRMLYVWDLIVPFSGLPELKNRTTRSQTYSQGDDLPPGMMGDRLVSLHLRFAPNSFGRDLERPGKGQRNREPNNKNEDDNLHRPLRRIERGKKNRCRLNREPRDDLIDKRDKSREKTHNSPCRNLPVVAILYDIYKELFSMREDNRHTSDPRAKSGCESRHNESHLPHGAGCNRFPATGSV
jgi:hypothetical protein